MVSVFCVISINEPFIILQFLPQIMSTPRVRVHRFLGSPNIFKNKKDKILGRCLYFSGTLKRNK